ncbi:four helix bundle protein [Candidatus Shapirobacteria bacterium]|nr:four helix bundle protein [Candidatus Shapirobacteria bacterium]
MTDKRDIHERIYRFVLRVLKLLESLPKTAINLIIIDQCGRAVTSVGANDQEADACLSKRDFLVKYGFVKKELKETNYWIRLIADTNPLLKERMKDLIKEGQEILLIVSSIINKTRKGKI